MHRRTLVFLSVAVGLGLAGLAGFAGFAGFAVADDMTGMNMAPSSPPATQPATQPSAAVDLRNTVCPVSDDKVGDSNIVEVYDGKVYHLCCSDCHKDFEKDPTKYAKAVAADPAKFGVK